MAEGGEPTGARLIRFTRRFVISVGPLLSPVEVHDLGRSARECAAEAAKLGHLGALALLQHGVEETRRVVGIVDGVDSRRCYFANHEHLVAWIAAGERPVHAVTCAFGQVFTGGEEDLGAPTHVARVGRPRPGRCSRPRRIAANQRAARGAKGSGSWTSFPQSRRARCPGARRPSWSQRSSGGHVELAVALFGDLDDERVHAHQHARGVATVCHRKGTPSSLQPSIAARMARPLAAPVDPNGGLLDRVTAPLQRGAPPMVGSAARRRSGGRRAIGGIERVPCRATFGQCCLGG